MPKLYQVSDGDLAIFKKVEQTKNPNWFSSYYLRGSTTGTWWHPNAITDKWRLGYETLFRVWEQKGMPDEFRYGREGQESEYRVVWLDASEPSFHHQHGFLFQPWQLQVYNAPQRIRLAIGGYGSGKTALGVMSMLVRAATLPGYRGVILAPSSNMTTAAFTEAVVTMEGTLYKERFLLKSTERPFPKITIGNSHIGSQNTIQFFPIGDAVGVSKILSLTVDEFFIDQAEQLFNFSEIIRKVGSRMRGMHKGRPRLGHMTFSANADDNEEMWDLFDEAERDPERVFAIRPKTWDNPFITDEQIIQIKKDVGGDEESIRVHMEGGRPVTGGEHFSAETLAKCKSDALDEKMDKGLAQKLPNYTKKRTDKIGVYEFLLPPEPGRNYLVAADPGYDNPPNRNSAVIVVFDYTGFPQVPAQLVGFSWVFGNHSPEPWLAKYEELVRRYQAYLANCFDSTGPQAGYERLAPALNDIHAYGMSLSGGNKFVYLNHLKRMCARGLFQFPRIPALFHQLSKYRLPDDKLRQDIVSALMIAAGWLEGVFYLSQEDAQMRNDRDSLDRSFRDRNYGRGGDRHMREVGRTR